MLDIDKSLVLLINDNYLLTTTLINSKRDFRYDKFRYNIYSCK